MRAFNKDKNDGHMNWWQEDDFLMYIVSALLTPLLLPPPPPPCQGEIAKFHLHAWQPELML